MEFVEVDRMHSFDRGLRERNYVYYVMCINNIHKLLNDYTTLNEVLAICIDHFSKV